MNYETLLTRLDRGADHAACWTWTGSRDRDGYGRVRFDGRYQGVHVVMFTENGGELKDEAPCVLHRCDNPPCGNPDHLFAGSHKANADDRESKGRGHQPKGDRHGRARLSSTDVLEMRRRHHAGETQRSLAGAFGVAPATVSLAIRGVTWAGLN